MSTYEICLIAPAVDDASGRPIRVSARYIENEPGLSRVQKAAIAALRPGEVWVGRAIQIKCLEPKAD